MVSDQNRIIEYSFYILFVQILSLNVSYFNPIGTKKLWGEYLGAELVKSIKGIRCLEQGINLYLTILLGQLVQISWVMLGYLGWSSECLCQILASQHVQKWLKSFRVGWGGVGGWNTWLLCLTSTQVKQSCFELS